MKNIYVQNKEENQTMEIIIFVWFLNGYDFVSCTFHDVNFALSHQLVAGEKKYGEIREEEDDDRLSDYIKEK